MISVPRYKTDVVLFYGGESLVLQVAEWLTAHQGFALRLVSSKGMAGIKAALCDAAVVIIDATQHPGEAMGVLEQAIRHVGPQKILVYTEQSHAGLEVFVRVRGVLVLLGPMAREEWQSLLAPLEKSRFALPLPRGD